MEIREVTSSDIHTFSQMTIISNLERQKSQSRNPRGKGRAIEEGAEAECWRRGEGISSICGVVAFLQVNWTLGNVV